MEAVKRKIEEWLEPLLKEKNFFLVDIKVNLGKKIEVYVDSDEGIHIDECAAISRFLEKHLDGSGLVHENYVLEVGSPGMTNPLKVPRQYKRRIGRTLEVLKMDGILFKAKLIEAGADKIKLVEEREQKKNKKQKAKEVQDLKEFEIRYDEIKRATLVFNF